MSNCQPMNEFPLMDSREGVPLFYPNVPVGAIENVSQTLSGRWIGQGPKVDLFEKEFVQRLKIHGYPLAVSSGTAALHLAYCLAGVSLDDEVICPVFTCTATNLPIIYNGGVPVFCDVAENSLNIDLDRIESLITSSTKAIAVVDYGGKPNDYSRLRDICNKHNLKLIADCAHALDGYWDNKHITEYADFTIYSFQAIKTLTTGDGGMLITRNVEDQETGKRIRWFGIDRSEKQKGTWENDIRELGYKYQMTDIAAAIGLEGLKVLPATLSKRRSLFEEYKKGFLDSGVHSFEIDYDEKRASYTPWMITINTNGKRLELMELLREGGVESAQVHYRNDRYSVFGKQNRANFPNMNIIENDYLVLPLHTKMSSNDVTRITSLVKSVIK